MNRKIYVLTAVIIAVLLLIVSNRYYYGVWNPFSNPDRIELFGRRYYKSIKTENFTENNRPKYFVYSFNLLAGKRIYLSESKGKYVPTVIYLRVNKNSYIDYELSGGP